MIRTDEDRRAYLRGALGKLDGLPLLILDGRPDQVHLELARIRAEIQAVMRSLGPTVRVPPLATCEDCIDA